MTDGQIKKEKKSKKVYEDLSLDVIDLSDTPKKSKKDKKVKKEKNHSGDAFDDFTGTYPVEDRSHVHGKTNNESAMISAPRDEDVVGIDSESKKKSKKHKREPELDEPQVEPESDYKKEKKSKKSKRLEEECDEILELESKKEKKSKKLVEEVSIEPEPERKKEKKMKKEKHNLSEDEPITPIKKQQVPISTPKAQDEDETGGAKYWKRIDEDKWKSKVDGTKFAKISHYDKGGDAWGNGAAEVLGQVKGKGFVKAMQKLKRASWKGQGQIDTGVNSVQFSDWEE